MRWLGWIFLRYTLRRLLNKGKLGMRRLLRFVKVSMGLI